MDVIHRDHPFPTPGKHPSFRFQGLGKSRPKVPRLGTPNKACLRIDTTVGRRV